MRLERFLAISSLAAIGSLGFSCEKNRTAHDTRSRVVSSLSAQPSAVSPSVSLAPPPASTAPPSVRRCPPDMVEVTGRFCVDRYESSMFDIKSGERASPYYHPTQHSVTERYKYWTEVEDDPDAGIKTLFKMPVPKPPDWQMKELFRVKAASVKGVIPNGYMSFIVSGAACDRAGKRLCTEAEWVTACRGEKDTKFPYGNEYQEGACNVFRMHHPAFKLHGTARGTLTDPRLNLIEYEGKPLLEETGSRPACVSQWGDDGIYDMVGNLDEWADDEKESRSSFTKGIFLGGFFSRLTKEGCNKKEGAHARLYYDYSLGGRCCTDLDDAK